MVSLAVSLAVSVGQALVDALFPRACVACDAPLGSTPATFCALCSETIAPCGDVDVLAPAMFGGALADAIRRAKFRPDPVAAELLARWLGERDVAWPRVDAIAFVPAPYRRRLRRGFDLPAVLARSLAPRVSAPVVDALACTRHDEPLSFGADKATRATIVAGRYRVRPRVAERIRERSVLLVDDVKTTGATLNEARRVLEGVGATVHLAVLAVAP